MGLVDGVHPLGGILDGEEVEDDFHGGVGLQLGEDLNLGRSADHLAVDANTARLVALTEEQDVLGEVALHGGENGLVLLLADELVALGIDLAFKVVLGRVEVAERFVEVDVGATAVTGVAGVASLLTVDVDGGLEAVSLLGGEVGVLEVFERDFHNRCCVGLGERKVD